MTDLEARLAVLEDEAEIRRLVARNQWRADGGSDDELTVWGRQPSQPAISGERTSQSLWIEGGGTWTGSGLSEAFAGATRSSGQASREESARLRKQWMPDMMHFLTNEEIIVESSTRAQGCWYSWEAATVLVSEKYESVWIAGRYKLTFRKERGVWKIAEMNFEEVFSTPFASKGWIAESHVPYGPGQLNNSEHHDSSKEG